MPKNKQRIVIVGGGFGGIKTALELADDERFSVTLISDKDHFLYYPALYATATGHSHLQSVVPLGQVLSRYPKIKVINDSMVGIDSHRKHVSLASGAHCDYDQLVLSLGVVTSYFGIKGLAEHSYSIKSKHEVERFKQHLHQILDTDHQLDKHYVVVGAGPTGVELSAALATYLHRIAAVHKVRHTKVRLSLVEAAPRVLPRMSRTASRMATKRLESLGVKVRLNARVESQDNDELFISGRPITTHTVIWTSGVSNHPFFGEHTDLFKLGRGGRVAVDRQLKAASNIYVIGDNADTPYTGLAQTALHDGNFVAKVLKAKASRRRLPKYSAVKPPVVVPVGEDWALFEWGYLRLKGKLASWLRRAADAIGYHDILPIGHALEAWKAEYITEESCPICREAL